MALSFTREDMVLYFNPKSHVRYRSREFVLWPAWAYRVVAPEVTERKLNLFQKAILGMCRVGLTERDVLASKLSLHPELISVIMHELYGRGFLTPQGEPTKQGLVTLDDEFYEIDQMVSGYVFQDPWSGEIWPRFMTQLNYCDREFKENGFPVLLRGPSGKPRRQPAFMVLPDRSVAPAQPSAASIIRAIGTHHRIRRFGADQYLSEDDYFAEEPHVGEKIERVSFIEEQPTPVFLASFLYLPESDASASSWYAADPFGTGASLRFRQKVEQLMPALPKLYAVVNRLVGRGLHDGIEQMVKWNEELRQAAELTVDENLTVDMRLHPAFERVVEMEKGRREGQVLGEDFLREKVESMLRAGVKVLEALFSALSQRYPISEVWKRLYVLTGGRKLVPQKDNALRAEIFRSAIGRIGFAPEIPSAFLAVTPGQIKSVTAYNDSWRLRPLICATLLAADQDAGHPMHDIAKIYPDFLKDADKVAGLGGAAGHANEQNVSFAEASDVVEVVYKLTRAITGFGFERAGAATSVSGGFR